MRPVPALIAVFSLSTCALAQADVYRWVNKDGQVQYSDRWVPGSVLIKTTKPRSDAARTAAPSSHQAQLAASNARIEEDKQKQASARALQADLDKTRSEQCKTAKESYEKAIQARRVYRPGKDGEREYLSETELAEYRLKARQEMDSVCGPSPK